MAKISFVIPLYNEQESLPELHRRLCVLMDADTTFEYEVILVNDGSNDSTEAIVCDYAFNDKRFHGVFLSRNFGHQLALTAGLSIADGDVIMILDGDLQDPPELYKEFYHYITNGYDVVYGVRKKRKEPFHLRMAYKLFYRIQKKMSLINIPLDSGDFSMITRRVLNHINLLPEESRFVRGLRSWVGYKQIGVEYERLERYAGMSKYSFKMLFKLAYNGIFNFSEVPIKFITSLGITAISSSLIFLVYAVLKKALYNSVPEGFVSIFFAIILFSGVQLISIGVIGEYVLRIFFQVKKRPLFIIKNRIQNKQIVE